MSNASEVTECVRAWPDVEVVRELRKITSKLEETDDEERLGAEWRLAATVIDRFFFIIFFIVQVIMCLLPTVIVPQLNNAQLTDCTRGSNL